MLRVYILLRELINFALALVSFFLILRIILKVFSTNPQTPFVAWIYTMSDFLMIPFANITPNLPLQTGIFDIVALITFIAYLAVSYLLISLINGLLTQSEVMEEEYPTTAHYHDVSKKKIEDKR